MVTWDVLLETHGKKAATIGKESSGFETKGLVPINTNKISDEYFSISNNMPIMVKEPYPGSSTTGSHL